MSGKESVAKKNETVKTEMKLDVTELREMKAEHVQRIVLNRERLASLGIKWVEGQGYTVTSAAFERGPRLVCEVVMRGV